MSKKLSKKRMVQDMVNFGANYNNMRDNMTLLKPSKINDYSKTPISEQIVVSNHVKHVSQISLSILNYVGKWILQNIHNLDKYTSNNVGNYFDRARRDLTSIEACADDISVFKFASPEYAQLIDTLLQYENNSQINLYSCLIIHNNISTKGIKPTINYLAMAKNNE